MADNYIERQQEQYEARKAAWKQAQKYGFKTGQPEKKSIRDRRSGRHRESNSRSIL